MSFVIDQSRAEAGVRDELGPDASSPRRDVLEPRSLGRDEAVTALFVAHHRRLVGLARLLVDDQQTAEDVVQEAFGQLYRRWTWLRDKDAAVPYLQVAVTNGARSALRRRRVRRAEQPVALPDVPSAELVAVGGEDRAELRACLVALPTRQRQVLVLRYYLDLSEAEIADRLAISKGSVKQHAARALAALSARLEAAQ